MLKWKLENRDRPLLAGLLAVALSLVLNWSFPVYQPQNKTDNHSQKEPRQDVPPWKTTEFYEALAAGVIAVYAIRQYGESRRSSERQLRAYVYGTGLSSEQVVVGDILGNLVVDHYEVWLPFENFGQTPAHDLRTQVTVYPFPMNEDRDLGPVEWGHHNRQMIGPGEKQHTGRMNITLAELTGSWFRQVEIAIRVRIEYRDVVEPDVVRITNYELRLEPKANPALVGKNPVTVWAFGPNNIAT